MIDFDDKYVTILELVIIGVVDLLFLGESAKDVIRDIVIAIGSMSEGRKLMSNNRKQ